MDENKETIVAMINLQKMQDCCGCAACVQRCPKRCISLEEDIEGFIYPIIDNLTCIDCGLCEKVCPAINQGIERKPLAVYAAKNNNEEIRIQSSSGGIFTLLAEQVLSESGIVFGARFDEKWEVVHDYTDTIEGLSVFRGAKYVQSRIGEVYKYAERFLKQDRLVLFSGTPCQVAGLRLFLQKEYQNLITVDLVCHGVPSPLVWRKYLKEVLTNKECNKNLIGRRGRNSKSLMDIKSIEFRNKKSGWKRFSFVLTTLSAKGCNENEVLLSESLHENIFLKGFLNDLYLRPSCYMCPSKKLKSGSDITIADYWGIQNVIQEFDDDKGISLVLVNTEKGRSLLSNISLELKETSFEDALKGNPMIQISVSEKEQRTIFFKQIKKYSLSYLIYKILNPSILYRIKHRCKSFINNF